MEANDLRDLIRKVNISPCLHYVIVHTALKIPDGFVKRWEEAKREDITADTKIKARSLWWGVVGILNSSGLKRQTLKMLQPDYSIC